MSALDPALLAHILAWFSSSPYASQIGFCGLLANLGGLFSLFVAMVYWLAVRQVFQKDHCVSGRNLPVISIMHINPKPVTLNKYSNKLHIGQERNCTDAIGYPWISKIKVP